MFLSAGHVIMCYSGCFGGEMPLQDLHGQSLRVHPKKSLLVKVVSHGETHEVHEVFKEPSKVGDEKNLKATHQNAELVHKSNSHGL